MAKESIRIAVDSDAETRKGSFADTAMISMKGNTARIDFILMDIQESAGSAKGVLTDRVFMDENGLRSLKDAVDAALKSTPGASESEN